MSDLTALGERKRRRLDHLAVLVPCGQRVALFIRRYAQPGLRFVQYTESVETLYDLIQDLPAPRTAVFVGSQYHGYLAPLLSQETHLCIIPGGWMRHLTPLDDVIRARFAVQLLEAQASEPIQWLHFEQAPQAKGTS